MNKIMRLFASLAIICACSFFNVYAQNVTTVNLKGHVYAAASSNEDTHIAVENATVVLQKFDMTGDSTKYMAITDSTGFFTFTSVNTGFYTLSCSTSGYNMLLIRNYFVSKSDDSIKLFLHDTTKVQGGIVSGKVEIKNEAGVNSNLEHTRFHAVIELINLDNLHANIFATTNDDGRFRVKVPSGQYYALCTVQASDSSVFFMQYYMNANSIAEAKIISVADGQVIEGINFEFVHHVNIRQNISIQGNVKSSSGAPIANAVIKVWSSIRLREFSWEEKDDDRVQVTTAKSDSNGNYLVILDSTKFNSFIVSAQKENFKIQFYNSADVFFDAQVLKSAGDTAFSDINFNLIMRDTANSRYSISGTVTDTANVGIKNVFVIAFDPVTGRAGFAISDSVGYYTVIGLKAGNYYLLFHADGFISQFYLNAYAWEDAAAIHLTGSVDGINVTLRSRKTLSGGGSIVGKIQSDNGIALDGALVTAFDANGNIVTSAITDANGSYSIPGIAEGSYTVKASITAYVSQNQETMYDPNNGSVVVQNFTMIKASVTDVNDDAGSKPEAYRLDDNYPNPFNPGTIIGFSIPVNSHVRLEIFNVLGEKVAELINKDMTAGHYSVAFNAKNFSSGVYLYKITTANFTSIKKMILSK